MAEYPSSQYIDTARRSGVRKQSGCANSYCTQLTCCRPPVFWGCGCSVVLVVTARTALSVYEAASKLLLVMLGVSQPGMGSCQSEPQSAAACAPSAAADGCQLSTPSFCHCTSLKSTSGTDRDNDLATKWRDGSQECNFVQHKKGPSQHLHATLAAGQMIA